MKESRTAPGTDPVRLQKLLADAGAGSRRAIEQQIRAGAVLRNGAPAALGDSAQAGDRIELSGQAWKVVCESPRFRSLVYNKPEGEVTTRADPQGRPTVFDRLPDLRDARWVSVGRLDLNTTGLLLLTTDGELANTMMHPSGKVDREYACRVLGTVDEAMLERLREGVELEDGPGRFSDIVAAGGEGANRWFHVTLMEGRNREVRRLWESQGVRVNRLKRVRYGALFLPRRLRMGQFEELSATDHRVLREDVGLVPQPRQLVLHALKPERGEGRAPRGAKPGPGRQHTGRERQAGARDRGAARKRPAKPAGGRKRRG